MARATWPAPARADVQALYLWAQDILKLLRSGEIVSRGEAERSVSVRTATVANVNLTNALEAGDTLDGVSLAAGDLILVKDQSAPAENGVYLVSGAGEAFRDAAFDEFSEFPGLIVSVREGTVNGDTLWLCTADEGGTINVTSITFEQVGAAPPDAEYIVNAAVAGLTAERVLTDTVSITKDAGTPAQLRLNVVEAWLPYTQGYLFNFGLANNATDANNDIDISAGRCRSAANTANIVLASAVTKRLDASWAVGTNQGGLDTGTKANSTWYHVHAIKRTDTGIVDVLFSLSATAPTMPANYSERRRIGSIRTDGSGNILAFTQRHDEFLWMTPVEDADVATPGTSAVTRTLTVPTGIVVDALIEGLVRNAASTNVNGYFSSLDVADQAPSTALDIVSPGVSVGAGDNVAAYWDAAIMRIRTNTSAQIRSRLSSAAADKIAIITLGWLDDRGKLS